MEVLLDLSHNIALVVALSVLFKFVARRVGLETLAGRLVTGLLFGVVVFIGMLTPVLLVEGLIFDGRSIILCAAGVLGGPIVAGTAALFSAGYRIYLGGGGVVMGVLVIIESAALGTLFYYLRRRNDRYARARNLLGLGALVHVIMFALMFTLPGGMSRLALVNVAPYVLTLYPLATMVVCRTLLDDEERLLYRDALAVSEEQLKLAIEASSAGMWDWRLDTGALTVNEGWADLLGYSRDELQPITFETWRGLVHPLDLPEAEELVSRHLRGESPIYEAEMRMRHKDGGWVWIVARGRVTARDSSGTPVRMTGTHLDVTKRVEAEYALQRSHDELEHMVRDVAEAMGRIVEARDPYTQGHQRRVAQVALMIATRMGLPADEIDGVVMAALLHDVGKTAVPAEILNKPGSLSQIEFALIKEHPEHGFEILKGITFAWPIAEIVRQHHERRDGSGYPRGLADERILIAARIIAVADVVEAMASHRPYRQALGMDRAIAEIRDNPERFDPEVSAALFAVYEDSGIEFAA